MNTSKKNEKKASGIGHNKPPKALATALQCGEALKSEASLTKNKNDATATRYRLFLALTCSNATMAQSMYSHWNNLPTSAGQNAETRERGQGIKNALFSMFGVPLLPTKEERDSGNETTEQEGNRLLIQRNCLDTVHLCAYVHEMHYETMFRFNATGAVYVTMGTTLADRIWAAKKWDKIPKLVQGDKSDIQIVSTTWEGEQGKAIAWSDLRTILISEGGRKGPAKRKTISDANVSEAIQETRKYFETNAPTANEMGAIRSSVENAAAVIKLSLKAIANMFGKGELTAFDTSVDAIFAVIGKVTPVVKVEGGSGNVVNIAEHNAAHDVVTPEAVKVLPSKAK